MDGGHRCRNRLLRLMSPDDLALIEPHLEPFACEKGAVMFRHDDHAKHAYFLDRGLLSLLAVLSGQQRIEAGLVGRDGFAPASLAMWDDRPGYDGVIQVPDEGHRIAVEPFRKALRASPSLREIVQRYALVLSVQTVHTVMAGAMRSIEERLARWILMSDDRWDASDLPLTHEVLALILSVRRPSITDALHALEGRGLIRNQRGSIVVRDRQGLETFVGRSYGFPEAEYERLIGSLRQRRDGSEP